jgi:hypothetical protein
MIKKSSTFTALSFLLILSGVGVVFTQSLIARAHPRILQTSCQCLVYYQALCLTCSTGCFIHPKTMVCTKPAIMALNTQFVTGTATNWLKTDPITGNVNPIDCTLQWPPFCIHSDEYFVCMDCLFGYYPTSVGCVRQNQQGCTDYVINTNLCQACSHGYYSDSRYNCARQSVSFCDVYAANSNSCLKCQVNYSLSMNRCIRNAFFVPNCQIFDVLGEACEVCQTGYYLAVRSCLPQGILNCASYEPNKNVCNGCKAGFGLWYNQCVVMVLGCSVYSDDGLSCLSCLNMHYFNTGTCPAVTVPACAVNAPDTNWCHTCLPEFQIYENTCVINSYYVSNCVSYDASYQTCLQCLIGFYLSSGKCVAVTIANCVSYWQNTNICQACAANYYLVNNYCVTAAVFNAGCLVYNTAQTACIICMPTYYLSSGTCQQTAISNCQMVNLSSNLCQICVTGYTLVDNQCIADGSLVTNCISYVAGGTACQYCDYGYYLSVGACSAVTVANCATFEFNTNNCQVCSSTYVLYNNFCVTQNIDVNCINYDTATETCVLCTLGYYLSGLACILGTVPNCLAYLRTSNVCQTCQTGYTLFLTDCVLNSLIVANCIQYSVKYIVCDKCQETYYLNGGICSPVPTNENCLSYYFNTNVCQACNTGWTLFENICITNANFDANCVKFVADLCVVCNTGYTLNGSNKCDANTVLNCALWLFSFNMCVACNSGYTLFNNFCTNHYDANCLQYDTSTGYCNYCTYLYYWDNTNKACVAGTVFGCQIYHWNTNLCQKCNSILTLFDSQCIFTYAIKTNCMAYTNNVCVLCAQGYYLSSGSCVAGTVTNCLVYAVSSNTCIVCTSGFLWNNVCATALITNCVEYDATIATCQRCATGYYLTGNTCTAVPTNLNCATFVFNTNICQTCSSGYSMWNFLCIASADWDNNCIVYDSSTLKCTTCGYGYVINASFKCDAGTVANCMTFMANYDVCTACPATHTLFNNYCASHPDPECLAYDTTTGYCSNCVVKFYWDSTVKYCKQGTVGNCATYMTLSDICQACNTGYTLFDNTCIPNASVKANCVLYSSAFLCLNCATGYYMTGGGTGCTQGTPTASCLAFHYNSNVCIECKTSHVFYWNGLCGTSAAIANCIDYDTTLQTCQHCKTNFYLQTNTCPDATPTDANCQTFVMNTVTCQACKSGYSLWTTYCITAANYLSQCIQYDTTTLQCTYCDAGYYLQTNTCSAGTVTSCSTYYHNLNRCQVCPGGTTLFNNYCAAHPDTNCQSYDSSTGYCNYCSFTYYWDSTNNVCTLGTSTVSNCDKFVNLATAVCQTCATNFFLFGNSCIATGSQVTKCQAYDTTPSCTFCYDGSYLSGSSCTTGALSNCLVYSKSANECTICDTSSDATMTVTSGVCQSITSISQCIDQSAGSCLHCNIGYYLSSTTCTSASVSGCSAYFFNTKNCQTCASGNTLWNNICIPNTYTPNCLQYDLSTLQCVLCAQGYYLSSGKCTASTLGATCTSWENNIDRCLTCASGYTRVSGYCMLSTTYANCVVATSPTACTYCAGGYYLSSGSCVATTSNCLISYYDVAKCQTPSSTYTVFDGISIPNSNIVTNGDEYDTSALTLISCETGYYHVGTTTCTAQSNGCNTYWYDTNFCKTCTSPKYLFNLACTNQEVTNCVQYDSSGDCKYCESGFYLSATNTCTAQSANCGTYTFNENTCLTCASSFQVYKTCPSGTEKTNCEWYDATYTTCLVCKTGYYLTSTNTCSAQNIPNCDTHVRNINACSQCASSYVSAGIYCRLSSSTDASTSCSLYDASTNTCFKCSSTFYLDNSGVCQSGSITNCDQYASSTVCATCSSGTLVMNQCVSTTISGCAYYDASEACTACLFGYVSDGSGGCTGTQDTTTSLSNCAYNDENGLCAACSSGFFIDFTTKTCSAVTKNCATNVVNVDYCLTCSSSNILNVDNCNVAGTSKITNCQYQDTSTTCKICDTNYFLSDDKTSCSAVTLPTNCQTVYSNTNICSACSSGTLLTGSCASTTVTNCVFYSQAGACILCDNLFYLSGGSCLAVTDTDAGTNWPNVNAPKTCTTGSVRDFMCVTSPDTNCLKYTSKTACEACAYGFYLSAGSCVAITTASCSKNYFNMNVCQTCQTSPSATLFQNVCISSTVYSANCLMYNSGYTACRVCDQGYYLASGVCTLKSSTSCTRYYMSSGYCRTCSSGTPFKDVCIPTASADTNCIDYNTSTLVCVMCKSGYYLDGSNKCQTADTTSPIANCNSYDFNTNKCFGCQAGYEYHETICISTSGSNYQAACLYYSSSTTKCLYCDSTHFLDTDATTCTASSITDCSTYTTNYKVCTMCTDGQLPVNNVCPATRDVNCLEYDPTTRICKYCALTYWWDSTNSVCTAGSVSNCLIYYYNSKFCQTCATNYFVFDNTCVLTANRVTNCVNYVANTCTRCRQGYYLSGSACVQTAAVANCLYYQASSATCVICSTGFDLYNNYCLTPVANCVKYDTSTGNCLACGNNFYLSGTSCSASSVANCGTYLFNLNVCKTCASGYTLWDTFCVVDTALTTGCIVYTTTACILCDRGYYLNSNTCTSHTISNCQVYVHNVRRCETCNTGYTLWNNNCVAHYDAQCLEYDTTTGYCKFCSPTYYWNSATNLCTLGSVTHCAYFVYNSNTCQECSTGYTLYDNTCILNANFDANCVRFSGGVCAYCLDGYYLTGTTCTQGTVTDCTKYHYTSNTCIECSVASMYNNLCGVTLVTNCIEYDSAVTACKSCAPGYYLSGTSCAAGSVSNCGFYWYNTNVCKACNIGYTLWKDQCVPNAQYSTQCVIYSGAGVCLLCGQGFHLDGSSLCVRTSITNCMTYLFDKQTCTACSGSYYLWNNNCVIKDVNCLEYDVSTKYCRFCATGYYFQTSTMKCVAGSVANCGVYAWNSDMCFICTTGTLQNNYCVPTANVDANCAYYASGVCTRCKDGYYLSGTTCTAGTKTNCQVYTNSADYCMKCSTGAVYQGYCVSSLITNCVSYSDTTYTTCTGCTSNLVVTANACVAASAVTNCLNYYFTSNICLLCAASYTLWNQLCISDADIVMNCAQYSPTTLKCVYCNRGYYFDTATSKCIAVSVSNCATYHLDSKYCYQCGVGTHIYWNNQCVPNANVVTDCAEYVSTVCDRCIATKYFSGGVCTAGTTANCLLFRISTDYCQLCVTNYNPWNNECIAAANWDTNCLEYTSGACYYCPPGYYVDGTSHCASGTTANCVFYLRDASTCQKCLTSYFLWNNFCFLNTKSVTGCREYDSATQACTICASTMYLSSTATCIADTAVANCNVYRLNYDQCWQCATGYSLANGACIPAANFNQYCRVYDTILVCSHCHPLYQLQTGACNPIGITNCATNIVNLAQCQSCATGFELASNLCVPSPSIANCAVYSDNTGSTCTSCLARYYLTGNTCPATTVQNCAVFTLNVDTCAYCSPGFYLKNNICYLDDPNCITFSANYDQCVGCKKNYFLQNFRCYAGTVVNCRTYTQDTNTCTQCLAGFTLLSNQCVLFIPGCQTYSRNGLTCDICNPGLALFSYTTCVVHVPFCRQYTQDGAVCLECENGYLMANRICALKVQNCQTYSAQGLCQECENFYYYSNLKCLPTTVQNCAAYLLNTNTCVGCKFRYALVEGLCVWDSPCTSFNIDDTCNACQEPFVLKNKKCVIPVDQCIMYSTDGRSCLSCSLGFRLQDNKCIFVAVCSVYDPDKLDGTCLVCAPGYYLDQGNCSYQTVAGCAVFYPNTNLCQECIGGRTLTKNKCLALVDDCWQYTTSGDGCLVCGESYYLESNRCLKQGIPNCVSYEFNMNLCRQCETGYTNTGKSCEGIKPRTK